MKQLQHLYLSGNDLVMLPETFGQLSHLKTLELQKNPLKNPPSEVCMGGIIQPIDRFLDKSVKREGKLFR